MSRRGRDKGLAGTRKYSDKIARLMNGAARVDDATNRMLSEAALITKPVQNQFKPVQNQFMTVPQLGSQSRSTPDLTALHRQPGYSYSGGGIVGLVSQRAVSPGPPGHCSVIVGPHGSAVGPHGSHLSRPAGLHSIRDGGVAKRPRSRNNSTRDRSVSPKPAGAPKTVILPHRQNCGPPSSSRLQPLEPRPRSSSVGAVELRQTSLCQEYLPTCLPYSEPQPTAALTTGTCGLGGQSYSQLHQRRQTEADIYHIQHAQQHPRKLSEPASPITIIVNDYDADSNSSSPGPPTGYFAANPAKLTESYRVRRHSGVSQPASPGSPESDFTSGADLSSHPSSPGTPSECEKTDQLAQLLGTQNINDFEYNNQVNMEEFVCNRQLPTSPPMVDLTATVNPGSQLPPSPSYYEMTPALQAGCGSSQLPETSQHIQDFQDLQATFNLLQPEQFSGLSAAREMDMRDIKEMVLEEFGFNNQD